MAAPAWLPNLITLIRIGLIPVVILLASACQSAHAALPALKTATLSTFMLIGVTDLIDGWVARRFCLVSQLGGLLDAFADKLVQLGLVAYFTFNPGTVFSELPVWFLGVLLGRDALLGLGWLVLRRIRGQVRIAPKLHGKLASFLTFVLLFCVFLDLPASMIAPFSAAIAVLILISTVDYIALGLQQLSHTAA